LEVLNMENSLAQEVGSLARKLGLTVAVAESATGGLISSLITDIAGSSDYFKGGVVAYDNEVKLKVLKVRDETLQRHGAVSAETAAEMALGVRALVGADIGLSDSGIAGPTGATPDKPVGLFYIGLATAEGAITEEHQFCGSRVQNKESAAQAVLAMLQGHLLQRGGDAVEERHVVTCFLEHEGKICLLRRSQSVGTYKGKWAGVSGYIEPTNSPLDQAFLEMREEAHLSEEDVQLVREGEPLEAIDKQLGKRWIIHPYQFRVLERENIQMDWEHTELRWVDPEEIVKYETVPKLAEAWERVSSI
jgi:PncC family amidohydrolase